MSVTLISLFIIFKSIFSNKKSILYGPVLLKNGLDINDLISKLSKKELSINISNYFLSTIVADHMASAIFFPETNASPLYFQTLP